MARSKPTRSPLRFLSPIHRATRNIGLYLEGRMAALGLGNPEAHLVSYLLSYGPTAVGDLTRIFGHKPSTLTSMLDRLERAGHIDRAVNPDDRRSFVVSLTARGKRIAVKAREDVEELERGIDAELEAEEIEGFDAVIAAIERITKLNREQE